MASTLSGCRPFFLSASCGTIYRLPADHRTPEARETRMSHSSRISSSVFLQEARHLFSSPPLQAMLISSRSSGIRTQRTFLNRQHVAFPRARCRSCRFRGPSFPGPPVLKSHVFCVFLTVCSLSLPLLTSLGEVADFLRACNKITPIYAVRSRKTRPRFTNDDSLRRMLYLAFQ